MKKKILIVLIIFLFGITFFRCINIVNAKEIKKEKNIIKKIKHKSKNDVKFYFIDVKGAVNNPGVYKVNKNLRVNDCINIAGGLRKDADTSILNLSKKIKDEMIIIVYTSEELYTYKKELKQMEEINKLKEEELVCPENSNDACINKKENKKNSQKSQEIEENENVLISINTASKEELMKLNGIGEGKADSIIEYREKNGGFDTIEDIKNVSGIGDAAFEKIKDYITV